MPDSAANGWEPQGLGKNWRAMFEQPRPPDAPLKPELPPSIEDAPGEDESAALDLTDYRPWILQRARTRPALMLELRRYEPRSGQWSGWAMAYHNLNAVDFVGARMLALDFGTRQFIIEGRGLDALARHIQQGTVLGIVEYNAVLWPTPMADASVTAIRRVETEPM